MEENEHQRNGIELKLLSNYTGSDSGGNCAICESESSPDTPKPEQEQVQNEGNVCSKPTVAACSDDGGTNDSHHGQTNSAAVSHSERASQKRVKRFDDLYEEVCCELKKNGQSIDLCEKLKSCRASGPEKQKNQISAVTEGRYEDEEDDDDLKRIQLVISYYPSILKKFTNSIEEFYAGKDEVRAKEMLSSAKSMGKEKSDEAIKVLNNALLVAPVTEQEWMKSSEEDSGEKLTHDKLGLEWFLGIGIPHEHAAQRSSSKPEQPQQREEVEQDSLNPASATQTQSPSVRDHNGSGSNRKVKDELAAQIYLERARRFNYTGAHESCILDIFTSIYYGAEKTFEIVYCLASSYKALGQLSQANLLLQHSIEILRASSWTNQRKSELTLQIVKQLKEIKSMSRTDDDGGRRQPGARTGDEDKINEIALFVGSNHEISSSSSHIPREHSQQSPSTGSSCTSTEPMKLYCGSNSVLIAASDAVQLQYDEQFGRHIIAKKTIPPGKTLILETPYAWSLYPDMYKDFCQHCCKKAESWVACQRCSAVIFCSWDCRREAERYHKFECPILSLLVDSEALGQMALLCYRTITNTPLPTLLLQKRVSKKMGPHNFEVATVDGHEHGAEQATDKAQAGNIIGKENAGNRNNCQSQNSSHRAVSLLRNDPSLSSQSLETNKEEGIRLLGLNSAGKLDPADYVSILAQTTNIEARPPGDILKRILVAIYLTLCLRFTGFFDYHQSSSSKCQGSPATESNLDIDSSMTTQLNRALRQNKIDDGKSKSTTANANATATERDPTGDARLVGAKAAGASQMEMSTTELRITILLFKHLQSTSCNAYEINWVDKGSTAKNMQITDLGGCTYPTISLTNHSCNPNIYRYNRGKLCIVKSVLEIQKGEQLLDSYGFLFTLREKSERQQFLHSNYFFNCECEACTNDWPKYAGLSDHFAEQQNHQQIPKQKQNTKSAKKNANPKARQELEELETKFQTYKQWLYDAENEKVRAHFQTIESTFTRYISLLQKLFQVPDKRLVVCQETFKMLWNLFPELDDGGGDGVTS